MFAVPYGDHWVDQILKGAPILAIAVEIARNRHPDGGWQPVDTCRRELPTYDRGETGQFCQRIVAPDHMN